MYKIYFIFIYCFIFLCVPTKIKAHEPSLQIYGEYTYNSSKYTFTDKPGAKRLEGKFLGDLLMPDTDFVGYSWKVRLEFIKDKLSCVSLMGPYAKDRIQAVLSQIRSEGFELLSVIVDKKQVDFLVLMTLTNILKAVEHYSIYTAKLYKPLTKPTQKAESNLKKQN